MGSRTKVGALAAIIAVSVGSLASAANFNEATVELTLGEKGKSKSTSLDLSVKITNKGIGKSPGQVEVTLPKGSELSDDSAPKCDSSTTAYDDCPAGSKIGTGSASFGGGSAYNLFVTNGESELTIWYELGPGTLIAIHAAVDGRTVTAPTFSVKTLKLKLDETEDGGEALIRTPPSCPDSGKWKSTVKTTYYGESGDEDDIVETDKPKTPCNG